MSLAPLLAASPAIQIHTAAAISAFLLGGLQLAAPKGTLPHRTLGWIWAALILTVAVTSLFIHEIRMFGPWSPIHLLAFVVFVTLPLGLWYARNHKVSGHRKTMIGIYVGALLIAGFFTFMPGRIMYRVLFGA